MRVKGGECAPGQLWREKRAADAPVTSVAFIPGWGTGRVACNKNVTMPCIGIYEGMVGVIGFTRKQPTTQHLILRSNLTATERSLAFSAAPEFRISPHASVSQSARGAGEDAPGFSAFREG